MYKNKRYRSGTGTLSSTAKKKKEDEKLPEAGILTQRNKSPSVEDLDEDILGSQSSIPSSQPPSQRRYVSQRSNMNVALSQIPGLTTGSFRAPDTYYEYVLGKCGAKCDHPENYLIDCDHIQFVSRIRNTLQNSVDYPSNISKFIKSFKSVVANDNLLSKTLSVCIVSLPNSNGLPQSQESLIKNLLMIDFLQQELLAVLLDRMQELAQKASGCEMISCILVMCLSQLKFINKIKHGEVVFNKIIDILESSPMEVKQIIIRHLDDVIEVQRHSEIIRKIMGMLSEDEDLFNEATLDAFGNMSLSTALLGELKERIFQYIDRGAPTTLYPKFTKLLLKYNEENSLPDLIGNIRVHLKWGKATRKELSDSHKSVLSIIKTSLMRSTKLSDVWLKSIKTSCTPEDHHPLDFVILVTMIEVNDDKSATIESLIRKKFTEELFTRRFLRDVVLQFPDFVVENLGIFLDIADHLFRSKERIWEIGKLAFKYAFGIDFCNRRVILSRLVGLVCEKTEAEVKTRALLMLSEIRSSKYFGELQNNGMQLLLIQENIGDIGLMQYRILMDILCSIAYPMPPVTAPEELVHEIDMLVKKQLANSNISVIRLGIIGAVKTIGHLVWHASEEDATEGFDPNQSVQSPNDFPDGAIREAAILFEMVIKVASRNCADSLAMCYDELALIFSNRRSSCDSKKFPNRKYLNWLSESLVDNFTNYFTIDGVPSHHEIEFIQKYGLIPEEENCGMSINVGGLTMTSTGKLESSITVLCPLFNLLRILQFRLDSGSLESLYGLCGFGVILPQYVGSLDELDIFDEFDQSISQRVLDMYFHTANWFREVVGSFSSQQVPQIRQQILTRLTELIGIEGQIRRMLKVAPSTYIAPNSTFIATQEKSQAHHVFKKPAPVRSVAGPSKRGSKKNADSIESQSTLSDGSKSPNTSNMSRSRTNQKLLDFATSYGPRENYRQMDLDIVLLLENQLLTEHTLAEDRVGSCIGLQEYKFIVEDLVLKLESFVGLRKPQCHQLQIITSPDALIHDLVAMLPQIQQHSSLISNELEKSLEAAEDLLESHHLYTENVNSLKVCFAITLRLYATLFSWTGFAEHTDLLETGLQVIAESAEKDIKVLASAAIANVLKQEKLALETRSALQMVYLVTTLTKIAENREEDQSVLTRLHENFLSKRWYTCTGAIERGGEFNAFLAELLKGVFRVVDFKQLTAQIVWIRREIPLLKSRDDSLKTFPGFTKSNFTHLFRALCTSLVDLLVRKLNDKLSDSGNLKMWESVIGVLDALQEIVKALGLAGNNLVFLKNANTILRAFLQHAIPLTENCLKKRKDQVMGIIRGLQDTTRFLNSVCCESKLANHAAVAAQIPLVRETLEKLVFHVMRLLTTNGCSSAFWMGILRNRNIRGEVIRREQSLNESADRTEEVLQEDEDMSEVAEQEDSDSDSRSRMF